MRKILNVCLVLSLWLGAGVALADEAPVVGVEFGPEETKPEVVVDEVDKTYVADAPLYERFVSAAPHWLVGLLPILIAIMIACRALSEALWIVAKKTKKTNVDDKVAQIIGRVAEILAASLGQIGIGMPKAQVMAKAEKIAKKELDADV